MPCIVIRSLVLNAVTQVVKTKVCSLKSGGWGKQALRAFVFGYILTLFDDNCEVWMPAKPNKRALFFQLGKGIKRFPDCGL